MFILRYANSQIKAIGTILCIQIDLICLIILNFINLNVTTYAQLILCQYISKDLFRQTGSSGYYIISPRSLYYGTLFIGSIFQIVYTQVQSNFTAESPQLILCLLMSVLDNGRIEEKKPQRIQQTITVPIDTATANKIDGLAKKALSIIDQPSQDQSKESFRKGYDDFSNIQQYYINPEIIYNSLEYFSEGLIILNVLDEQTHTYKISYMNNATRILFGKDQDVDILYILENLSSLHIQSQDFFDDFNSRRDSAQQKVGNLSSSKLCKSLFPTRDFMFCSLKQALTDIQLHEKYQTMNMNMKDLIEKIIKSRRQDSITVNTHVDFNFIDNQKQIKISQNLAQSRQDNDRLMEFKLTLQREKTILIVCRDVTHRQKIRYLREYDIQKSKMLSFVSHEYRQPLGCIIQMIECALQYKVIQKNVEITEDLQAALDNSKYMLNLSNDLLDLAQIKNGKFKIQKVPFNLEKLIADSIKMFALKAKIKDLQLVCDYNLSLPKFIISDKNRIKQIIVNLLSNAFKFTCTRIQVIVDLQGNQKLRIGVKDDGIGISQEEQQVLFKAFSKVNSEESKKLNEQGVGLGLVISNQIAQNIGCSGLNIESNKDQNNHFSFFYFDIMMEIPTNKKKVPSFKIPQITPQYQEVDEVTTFNQECQKIALEVFPQCCHYLIVDDDCFNGYAFKRILMGLQSKYALSFQQFDVEYVSSGKDSLSKIQEKKCNKECQGYKLIFMDVEMPVMNGMQTTKQLLNINPKQLIVGCSGYSDVQEKQKCLEAGMVDYLTKPVMEKDLIQILQKYQ
ncbi:unnamed protein product (macronuclear) [Paramecium tetraurelia]|uniref:Uncharacterized protein n=1 Tax=Paramecium tetraurelia TaxID=5888 RepID=A0D9W7_PARTE|nr:uncharacterized protein GSPATT00014766001 [Paramecium tetraurelia]CAK79834.1 unnamed protein product [Paramecium tetraurelia]|eukprot:XP_001447231.1 hypothetical protein (macronuclear) [Paramecium tetraurelia strain d4-2]